MKCYKCGVEVEPGLHICAYGNPVYYEFEPRAKLPSIMDAPGQCVACGFRCTLKETEVNPDYSTPRCPVCHNMWIGTSTTERISDHP